MKTDFEKLVSQYHYPESNARILIFLAKHNFISSSMIRHFYFRENAKKTFSRFLKRNLDLGFISETHQTVPVVIKGTDVAYRNGREAVYILTARGLDFISYYFEVARERLNLAGVTQALKVNNISHDMTVNHIFLLLRERFRTFKREKKITVNQYEKTESGQTVLSFEWKEKGKDIMFYPDLLIAFTLNNIRHAWFIEYETGNDGLYKVITQKLQRFTLLLKKRQILKSRFDFTDTVAPRLLFISREKKYLKRLFAHGSFKKLPEKDQLLFTDLTSFTDDPLGSFKNIKGQPYKIIQEENRE